MKKYSHSQQAATALPNWPQKLQKFALLKHTQKKKIWDKKKDAFLFKLILPEKD